MKGIPGIRWLVGLGIVIGLVGMVVIGRVVYIRLLYTCLLILIISWLWTSFSLRGIKCNRQARMLRASVGDIFEERFEIHNTSRLTSLWIEVFNDSPVPRVSGSRLLTLLGAQQRRSYIARTMLIHRGAFPLGPTRLVSGDPFGLFTSRLNLPAEQQLVVLPMIVPITSFPLSPGLLPGGKAIRQKTRSATPHAVGVREYTPGDPMRHIHWPSTAKRGHFMVKEFELDPQAEVWLFLDAEQKVHTSLPFPEPPAWSDGWLFDRRPSIELPPATLEYSIVIAASLVHYYYQKKRAVGLVVAGQFFKVIAAERSERQEYKILETLALLEAKGSMTLGSLVEVQAKLLPRGSSVVLITPSMRTEIQLAAQELIRRNLRPFVLLLMADTFGGVPGGARLADQLARSGIPVCTISNSENISLALSQFAAGFPRQEMETWLRYPYLHWI